MNDDIKFFLINRALVLIDVVDEAVDKASGWATARLYRAERNLLKANRERHDNS